MILALFLFTASVTANEEKESQEGKTTLRTLLVDGVTGTAKGVANGSRGLYRGTRYALKEGACDGTRATYDGAKWLAHETPADHGRNIGRAGKWAGKNSGRQAAKTPGYAWRATKWGLGHLW